ncbi:MAG: hypothetical protein JNM21_14495 [Taibaiella sp.]|nr:hypothetical protein [Taibaiella sp.]
MASDQLTNERLDGIDLDQVPDSLYEQYESYSFEIMTWEELDPETFECDNNKPDKQASFYDQFINHKIKFFAYLSFFQSDSTINQVLKEYEPVYKNAINDLLKSDNPEEGFKTKNQYLQKEQYFKKELIMRSEELNTYYTLFTENYDTFFNKIGHGFYLKVEENFLVEQGVLGEKKTAKKIKFWDNKDQAVLNKLRAFPLLHVTVEQKIIGNQDSAYLEEIVTPLIKYVVFIDGYVRQSVDFFTNKNTIARIYLPKSEQLTIPGSKTFVIPTFSADSTAIDDYLKNIDQVSIHFNPTYKIYDTRLSLVAATTNIDQRGVSIY